jgi:hypothetical protein
MKIYLRATILSVLFLLPAAILAQTPSNTIPVHIRSSPAYAELLLRTTEVRAELESIAPDYSETSSRLADLRSELQILGKATIRLSAVRAAESPKLTTALGMLLVRKAAIDTELARLLRSYKDGHPDVRRARRRSDIFEAAIKEVLP